MIRRGQLGVIQQSGELERPAARFSGELRLPRVAGLLGSQVKTRFDWNFQDFVRQEEGLREQGHPLLIWTYNYMLWQAKTALQSVARYRAGGSRTHMRFRSTNYESLDWMPLETARRNRLHTAWSYVQYVLLSALHGDSRESSGLRTSSFTKNSPQDLKSTL